MHMIDTSNGQQAGKAELGLIDERFETFGHDVDTLAAAKVSDDQAISYFISLYAKPGADGKVSNEKSLKRITEDLIGLYRRGPGAELQSAKGTAWGLVNAVTRYEDFSARAHSKENRFNNGQFGIGANRKEKSFAAALKLAA